MLASALFAPCRGQAGLVHAGAVSSGTGNVQSIRPDWPATSQAFLPPVRQAGITPHVPWKSRLKSVLEETNPQIGEEADLGPALVPDGPLSVATIEPLAGLPAASHPLRC
jgi:hypothetical protein